MPLPASALAAATLGLVVAVCGGCARITKETTLAPGGLPAALLGEWAGSWTSVRATSGVPGPQSAGAMRILLQTFGDRPVVRLAMDNPCLAPRTYTLAFAGSHFELRSGGVAIFTAVLADDLLTMAGTFACPEDRGGWSIERVGDLPAIGDVSGTWFGSFESVAPLAAGTFTLTLEQRWDDGTLAVDGEVDLVGTSVRAPIRSGFVEWDRSGFRLLLATDPAAGPQMRLGGIGSLDDLIVLDGLLVADPDPRLPFRIASWNAAWIGR